MPRFAIVCYGMTWFAMLFYGILWHGMLCYGMLCYGMLCYGMLCYGMLCHGMLCPGVLWYAMLWYALVWYALVWYGLQCFAMVWYVCIALFFPISFVTLQTPGANLGGAQAEGRGRATLPQRGEIRGLAQGTEDSRGFGPKKIYIINQCTRRWRWRERNPCTHRKMDGWVDR